MRRFEVSATITWKLVWHVDAQSDVNARIEASKRLSGVLRNYCPQAKETQIISFPSLDDYEVTEIALDPKEQLRRKHLDELASQFVGPIFKRSDRLCKWRCGEGGTFLDLESGQEFIDFDGGTGTIEEYDAWREAQIARSDAHVKKLREQSNETVPNIEPKNSVAKNW